MISHPQFIERLLAEFPSLQSELSEDICAGLLHVETGCFARHTQAAIDNHDTVELRRCFDFATAAFRDADSAVKNAMYVSYLEHLNFEDGKVQRAWALTMMPPILKAGWVEINEYLDDLFSKKTNKRTDKA